MKNKKEIIEKYKKLIEDNVYFYYTDEDIAHIKRDELYYLLLIDLGYEELADYFKLCEYDIGFWYS